MCFRVRKKSEVVPWQDVIISSAVMIQSLLVVLQIVMMDVLHMPEESTTVYRVVLTALPMSVAIVFSAIRKPIRFIVCYAVTLLILLFNGLIFPNNASYMWQDAIRFIFPVVLPSTLCLTCVTNVNVVCDALYKISWGTFCLAIVYVLNIFFGNYTFSGYNMGFSYGLLLPALSLYSRSNKYSIPASIILFIIIVVFGSRGAAIIYVMYITYDLLTAHKKLLISAIFIVLVLVALTPVFMEVLNDIGISSRTLTMLFSGNFDSDSGRSYYYNKTFDAFLEQPIIGLGLWGDRPILNGSYCHNFILELYTDWGIAVATLILITLVSVILYTYVISSRKERMIIVIFFLAGIVPLMASGSYLTDYTLATFLGILCLILKDNLKERQRLKIDNIINCK